MRTKVYNSVKITSCNKDMFCSVLQLSQKACTVPSCDADFFLSYDVASTPCNKIDKPIVVYRFSGNVMTSISTLHTS